MKTIFTFVLFLISIYSFAQAGTLDPGFGTNGKVVTLVGNSSTALAMKVQPDGKIIMAGYTSDGGSDHDIAIARYNTNGTLDHSFSSDGIVSTEFGGIDHINAIDIQQDGKIIVGGHSTADPTSITNRIALIARYLSDGSPDVSFNGTGFIKINPGEIFGVKVQPDGKIVAGGSGFQVYRVNANGTMDNSFGTNGIVVSDVGHTNKGIHEILLQPDGKIIAGGFGRTVFNSSDYIIARYLPNGQPDPGFAGDGVLNINFPISVAEVNGLALQSDGKIVAGGNPFDDVTLVRILPNGTLDNSFDGDGIARLMNPTYDEHLEDITIQPDGKIISVGTGKFFGSGNPGPILPTDDFITVRFLSNGSLDNSFDGDGTVVTPISMGSPDLAYAVALWQDRIYVGGWSYFIGVQAHFALIALQNDINTQPTGPYTVNGAASSIAPLAQGQNCFMLTPAQLYQAGSVWNNTQLNLSQSFEITTRLYFGAQDGGADGLAFVLQRAGTTALGTAGGGLGYADIPGPSFIIEFDTYQNSMVGYNMSDPIPDHIGFMSHGSASHNPSLGTALTSPINFSVNIEDGQWHDALFRWNVLTKTMSVTILGQTYSYQGDIATTIFGGNTMVNWGFTASTGSPLVGITPSEHRVCILSATANLQGRAVMDEKVITRVQPNPTKGVVDLQFKEEVRGTAEIVITNGQGTVVERRTVQVGAQGQLFVIDLSRQPKGLYLARITAGGRSHTQKIVLQ